jgi:hypothetical protein
MKQKSTFKIRPDLCAEFESIRDKPTMRWTPEIDAVLLKYWKLKTQSEFARMFSKRFFKAGRTALNDRYKKLIEISDKS